MTNKAIEDYIAAQPADRQGQIRDLRALINKHIPKGYEEVFNWGMITWEIPLSVYPDTYNKKPLMYLGLANRKNYITLTLFGLYCDKTLKEKFLKDYEKKTGKKPDMGAGCLRFKHIDDLPLDLIAWAAAAQPVERMVETAKGMGRK